MKLTGSQVVIEVLLDHGVDTVFGYPGGTAYFQLFCENTNFTVDNYDFILYIIKQLKFTSAKTGISYNVGFAESGVW